MVLIYRLHLTHAANGTGEGSFVRFRLAREPELRTWRLQGGLVGPGFWFGSPLVSLGFGLVCLRCSFNLVSLVFSWGWGLKLDVLGLFQLARACLLDISRHPLELNAPEATSGLKRIHRDSRGGDHFAS